MRRMRVAQWTFRDASSKENGDEHESGAVRRGHQERPQREIPKAHTHPHPSRMSRSNKTKDAKADEHCRCDPTQGV